MRTITRLMTIVLGVSSTLGLETRGATPEQASTNAEASSSGDEAEIKLGKYVAQLGDCAACHTAGAKGPAMAGGYELATPFGKIYSTNITPDRQTGIGKYSFEQFDRVMRRGVAADGHNLYPAMPYPSYAKMNEQDMHALYAYFMHGVAPVNQSNKPAEMRWPFSVRSGLAVWNWVFLDDAPFRAEPTKDSLWNRGAYLVQGLGHCGSCHTPRGVAFQEKAMSEAGRNGKYYLAGETVEGWRALSLRNLWTVDDTVLLLKTGRNQFTTVSGSMVEVIHHSSQYFGDADLRAVATYLKSLPPGGNDLPQSTTPKHGTVVALPDDLFKTRGGLGYVHSVSIVIGWTRPGSRASSRR